MPQHIRLMGEMIDPGQGAIGDTHLHKNHVSLSGNDLKTSALRCHVVCRSRFVIWPHLGRCHVVLRHVPWGGPIPNRYFVR